MMVNDDYIIWLVVDWNHGMEEWIMIFQKQLGME